MTQQINPPRILVFDSGVGGLSVLREIQQRLPACQFFYASDNQAFPYGTKNEETLIARVDQVLHGLVQQVSPDIIVVACNTASTLTLPHIRSHFTQPIVGVVPAIKPAAAQSHSRVIGLLATPATVARPYTRQLIQEYANHCCVIPLGSSELVEMAEAKLRGDPPSQPQLSSLLAPLLNHPRAMHMDTLVLACTHFPLLREELIALLPSHIQLIDSGEAIARRVEFLLQEKFGLATAPLTAAIDPQLHRAIFTEHTPGVERLRKPLQDFAIHRLDILSLQTSTQPQLRKI